MILTITTNPSLDIIYRTKTFSIGVTNRETSHQKVVGGKGINAARVVSTLNGSKKSSVIATGFVETDGYDMFEKEMYDYQITDKFIKIPGKIRYCYQIYDQDKRKTELNEIGTQVSYESSNSLLQQISTLKNLTAVSINGSIASGLPQNYYSLLIEKIRTTAPNAKIILDTSGSALHETLKSTSKPDIIKPNNAELSDLLGYRIEENPNSALKALQDKQLEGIPMVVVSLGATGAVVKIQHGNNPDFYFVKTRALDAKNTQGAGDSTVGGMLYAIDQDLSNLQIIKYGMAAGMANVIEQKTGYINTEDVSAFVEDDSQILIQKINLSEMPK